MNVLKSWIETALAHALGWALLHFLWEGALIALLLAGILRLCHPRSARLRYTFALMALLAMPIAFGLTTALSWPVTRMESTPAPSRAHPVISRQEFAATEPVRGHIWDRLPWLTPVWMAGVLLFYVHSLAGWMAAQRLRRIGVCAAPALWQERLLRLARGLGLSRPVVLLESCLVDTPVVTGFFRPVILIPLGLLTGFPVDQVEYILIHELAHLLRHDYLVNLLQSFVEGLLFYHPAVWWVSGLVRDERENCCDDAVVALRGDAREYAKVLAALEQSRSITSNAVLAASGGNLMERVRRLLQEPASPRAGVAPLFPIGLLLVSAALAMATRQPKPAPAPPPLRISQTPTRPAQLIAQTQEKPTAPAETSPYTKWLEQDVAYITTDAERLAFKRLQTDEEREHFIEQFWLRRDPTPNTVENEYKEEHYRRIAYSNERFKTAGVWGWKTDRGRTYIVYGPPDEFESHPSGQDGGSPFEFWRYRHIDGIGDNVTIGFTDENRTGEYRMTTPPPWAAPRIPVEVGADGVTTISIPFRAGAAGERFNIYGRVSTPEHRVVNVFEYEVRASNEGMLVYNKSLSLPPGSYILNVVIKDPNLGTITHEEEVGFEVK